MPKRRSIVEEIGQTRPFPGKGQEVLVTLLRTTDEVRRYLGGIIDPEGITLQQYNVLRILRGAGPEGLPTLEVGRRMLERQPGITRLVDRLVKKGLADRERDRDDRRRVVCRINSRGMELLDRIDERMSCVERDVAGAVPAADIPTLLGLLDDLRAHLREAGPDD